MKNQLINYVKAGYPGLYIISHEEQRVEAEMRAVAAATKFKLHAWSITSGLLNVTNGEEEVFADTNEPTAMLDKIADLPEKSIVLLRDFHLFLQEVNAYNAVVY